nr:MAG TPA: hypothetical protein [Caudoviricetes sp.]
MTNCHGLIIFHIILSKMRPLCSAFPDPGARTGKGLFKISQDTFSI